LSENQSSPKKKGSYLMDNEEGDISEGVPIQVSKDKYKRHKKELTKIEEDKQN
jgi:hypothetical protein